MPIRIRNRLWINLRLLRQPVRLVPGYVNHAVDDRMRDMHALGTEFPSEGLRHGAEGEFHGGEGGEEGGAFDGGGGAGEDEGWGVGGRGGGGEEEGEGRLGKEEGSFAVGGGGLLAIISPRRHIAIGMFVVVCRLCRACGSTHTLPA